MSAIEKLVENLKRGNESAKQAQIRFVECVAVDWENKRMDAKDSDGIEYLDIILGFGYTDIKPSVGSLCLIGIIDGMEVVTFLIDTENAELVEINAATIKYNNGKNGGLIKVKELTDKINILQKDLNDIKTAFKNWIPVSSDGGAALKISVSKWAGSSISITEQGEIENTKILH